MRLIESEELKHRVNNFKYYGTEQQRDFCDMITESKTIDAVEVVRCSRCEWWKCNPNTTEYGVCKKVSYDDFEVIMDSDDFCSYGIHREDGEHDE